MAREPEQREPQPPRAPPPDWARDATDSAPGFHRPPPVLVRARATPLGDEIVNARRADKLIVWDTFVVNEPVSEVSFFTREPPRDDKGAVIWNHLHGYWRAGVMPEHYVGMVERIGIVIGSDYSVTEGVVTLYKNGNIRLRAPLWLLGESEFKQVPYQAGDSLRVDLRLTNPDELATWMPAAERGESVDPAAYCRVFPIGTLVRCAMVMKMAGLIDRI